MGPIRGFKGRKKAEKKVDQNVLAAASAAFVAVSDASTASSDMTSQQTQIQQAKDWWDEFSKRITGPLSEKKFESFFKMSRKTFDYICSLVEGEMTARQSNVTDLHGRPLCLKDQVAVALRRLSSGESLSNIGELLGINQSTVSQITWRFVEALEEKALHHIKWPSSKEEMEEIKHKFETTYGLPNCCGAIDITHIVMTLSAVDDTNNAWIDRQGNYSMILQAIVDTDMRFRDVLIGYPGCLKEWSVLENSSFFKRVEEQARLNGKKVALKEGLELGEYILGDSGFPSLPWLITPYQQAVLEYQQEFNNLHAATHSVALIALARLKHMWRIIRGVMWLPDKNKLPRIAFCCCLLHNIIIDMEDKVLDEMPTSVVHDSGYRQQNCQTSTEGGTVMRETLALYLSGKFSPGKDHTF